MKFAKVGTLLKTEVIKKKDNSGVFSISKVLLKDEAEVVDVFSQEVPPYEEGELVDLVINVQLAAKKVSCNFAH